MSVALDAWLKSHSFLFAICSVKLIHMKLKLRLGCLALIFFAFDAKALSSNAGSWDYLYALGFRSEPIGLSAWGELGYNHLLWGDSPGSGNPFYGYIRPKISARSSGVVNRADVGLDISLWAPIVFDLSYGWDHRNIDFSEFNCELVECRGLLTRAKAAAKLSLGYGQFFF